MVEHFGDNDGVGEMEVELSASLGIEKIIFMNNYRGGNLGSMWMVNSNCFAVFVRVLFETE